MSTIAYRDFSRRTKLVKPFDPCLPRKAKEPPRGPNWIHEIKHDGIRILARKDGDQIKLITRNGYDFADRYRLIVDAIASLPVDACIIDGEAIVVDQNGLSVFDLLRYRRHDHATTLCAFDLLNSMVRTYGRHRSKSASSILRGRCAKRIAASPSTRPMTATARRSTSMPAHSDAKAL